MKRRFEFNYGFDTFRGDLFGGITSTVVALPVSLAFGVASGLGAAAGLYGAIAVGFFAAVFGGTRSQISGPTAPMAVAMAVIITSHASNLTEALTVVMLGGLLQVLIGVLRIGRFIAYTPHVVVSGFMTGIGIIVMLIQTLPFLGAPTAAGGPMGAIRALPEALANLNVSALVIAVVTLAIGVLWPRRMQRFVPAALVALIVGTLLGVLTLRDAPVIGAIPSGLPELHLELPSVGFLLRALQPALILALLGSVDSLLTSLVADSLTGTQHNPDRELVGQGIGNLVAGLFGGVPGAGATMGTVTNIRAGGTTRMSGVLRAILLLALLLGLGRFVEPIPHAVLAGILMKVGWDIVDWRMVLRLHRIRREHLIVLLITLGLTVFVDLVTAVAIGLIAAGMAHARQLERLELDSVVSVPLLDQAFFSDQGGSDDPYAARVGLVALRGGFTVASAQKLVGVIGPDIRDHEVVIFDFSGATYMDDSAAMLIRHLMDVAAEKDTPCIVMGLSGAVAETLDALDILHEVPEGQVVDTLDEARQIARTVLTADTVRA
ncbi:MAG: SulP family inorganic anion transporter [Spirochaetaceae bacterium]|nr:SulP family inorganic anion transporter [Spirochaetaceae bacterium]